MTCGDSILEALERGLAGCMLVRGRESTAYTPGHTACQAGILLLVGLARDGDVVAYHLSRLGPDGGAWALRCCRPSRAGMAARQRVGALPAGRTVLLRYEACSHEDER